MPVPTEQSCPHPYFSLTELVWFASVPVMLVVAVVAGLLILVGGVLWLRTRSRLGAIIQLSGVLLLVAWFGGFIAPNAGSAFRSQFSADDLARLQRELQLREADLARYSREHANVSNSQIVKGFLETHRRWDGFYFSDPKVPPLFFKVSDWRDKVPRVVVSLGCSNNIVFYSLTMDIEQLD